MKTKVFLFAILAILLTNCKKDETKPDDGFILSGVVTVDSVDIEQFVNGEPYLSLHVSGLKHNLDFRYKNHVIERTDYATDTCIFQYNQSGYALTDFDFNGTTDTTFVHFGSQSNTAVLETDLGTIIAGADKVKSVKTYYVSR